MADNKKKYPTMAGRRALLNIAAGLGSATGLYGMSKMGGHRGTMLALRRSGLVTMDEQLTDEGKAMVERLTGKAMEAGHA